MNLELTDQGTRSAANETETSNNDGSFREFLFSTSPMSLERPSPQRRYKSSCVGCASSHYPSVYDVLTASVALSHDPWKQGEREVPHHLTMNNDSQSRQRQQQSELEYQRQNEQRLNAQHWEREAELQRYHAQALLASRMDQLDLNDPGRRKTRDRSDRCFNYEPDWKTRPTQRTPDYSAYSRQRNQRHPNRYQSQELKKPLPPPPPPTPAKKRAIEIEITPGVFAVLHGSDETIAAIERGAVVTTICLLCECRLQCVDDCLCVLCPDCRVVSPVLLTDAGETPDKKERSGVGLGLKVQS